MSRAVQDLPLEGLRVVEERALIAFVNGDLKHNPWLINIHVRGGRAEALRRAQPLWELSHITMDCEQVALTSCCLKSQTA